MNVTVYTRLDTYLAENGYAGNREKARELIEGGKVMVNGQSITSPAFPMLPDFELKILLQNQPWVSQSGPRLESALQAFRVNPGGRVALDAGAGTGGFTDALLARNARHVYCVDILQEILHERIKADNRVTALGGMDIRTVSADQLSEKYDLIVAEIDAISLTQALPRIMDLAPEGTELIAVVIPRFELEVEPIPAILDPAVQKQACLRVERWLRDEMKWTIKGWLPDPPAAPDGSTEFFVHAMK